MPHLITRRQSLACTAGLAAVLLSDTTSRAEDVQTIGLGFSIYGMKTLPLATAIKTCREIGYDCVELPLMPGWAADPEKLAIFARKELKAALEKSGLRLSALMENLPILGDDKVHAANLQRLTLAAELAHELFPKQPPLIETILGGKPAEWEAVKGKMAERLKDWARIAEEKNIIIAIKAHVAGALHAPADAVWLLEQVSSKSVRLAFDQSHFELQKISLENALDTLLPHTVFIHVKDAEGDAAKFQFLLPAEKENHYAEYFKLLAAKKYHGDVVVEVSGQIHSKPGYDPVAAARKCYEPLAKAMKQAGVKRG
ncbi:MAG: sugar phosphate isomerase/epimerase family protein [Pirellulaceae bacterium]